MSAISARDRLVRLVGSAAAEAGFDVEDVIVRPAGSRRLLRVVVDRDDGVSLDDTASLSRRLSGVLDASGAMGEAPYVLEVTSPGVDRPLTEPRHWRRAVGRLVRVPLRGAGSVTGSVTGSLTGSLTGTVTGRVRAADGEKVLLEVAGSSRRFAYDELGRGRVQVEFHDGSVAGASAAPEEGEPWTST